MKEIGILEEDDLMEELTSLEASDFGRAKAEPILAGGAAAGLGGGTADVSVADD